MASGAALRARVISALRSAIRYWSSGAMLEYGALASCASACHAVLSTTTSTKLPRVIVLTILRFIDFPLRYGLKYAFKPMMRQSQLIVVASHNTYRYVCWGSNTSWALGRTPLFCGSRKASEIALWYSRSMLQPSRKRRASLSLPLAPGLVPRVASRGGRSPFFGRIASSGDPANSFLKRRTPPTPRSGTSPFHSRLYHSALPCVSVPRAVPPPWRRASPYKLLPSFCGIPHQYLTSLETS